MSWGEWMVPTLSEHDDLELRRGELELTRAVEATPEAVAALAAGLLRQSAMQQSIIEQAARRIMELEAREVAQEMEARMAAKRRGWWGRLLIRSRRLLGR